MVFVSPRTFEMGFHDTFKHYKPIRFTFEPEHRIATLSGVASNKRHGKTVVPFLQPIMPPTAPVQIRASLTPHVLGYYHLMH